MPPRKLLGAAAITAAVLGGGAAGALIGVPAVTVAQEADDSTTTTSTADSRPAHGACHGFRPGGVALDTAAEALGMSEADLRQALRDGSSIADVAAERNVDVKKVIDALVAEATARIDDEVADGDLAADRAAELKEDLEERITNLVNREGGFRRPRFGH